MKKIFTFLVFIVSFNNINAQAPQGFSYQATVRNSSGDLIANQNVYFKFNVMLNSSTSVPVFSETHYVPTDDLGQVNLTIGQGTATTGTFSTINWGTGNYYLGIELNTGNGYVAMGTTQLLSVPYALYANSSGNSQVATPNLAAVLAVGSDANNTKISNLADPVDSQDAATKGYVDVELETQLSNLKSQIAALQNTIGITIGKQVWMNKNFEVTTYRDGTPIPEVTDPTAWVELKTGAWCYYNNDAANGATYGKLYNWYAVAGIHDVASLNDTSLRKQFAPIGWHVPTDSEWATLITFLGEKFVAGSKLKEVDNLHWHSPNTDATNSTGFTCLPGGSRYSSDGLFYDNSYTAYLQSSSEKDATNAWSVALSYGDGDINRPFYNKTSGFSVRCLRD